MGVEPEFRLRVCLETLFLSAVESKRQLTPNLSLSVRSYLP